jgi:hypothetical protein
VSAIVQVFQAGLFAASKVEKEALQRSVVVAAVVFQLMAAD